MTGYEMEEYIREGKPFYVFGDVMEYDSSKGDKGSPHSLYRELLSKAQLAVSVRTKQEYDAWRIQPKVKQEIINFLQELSKESRFEHKAMALLDKLV